MMNHHSVAEPLSSFSATVLISRLNSRQITAREVMISFLDSISKSESSVKAFLTLPDHDELLRQAEAIDDRRLAGGRVGTLAGLPIAIKDNICTRSMKTTCGSQILKDFIPPYHATVVQRVVEEDGIILGKTNLDEFSMGSSTENSSFNVTRNPHNLNRVPGGTSGGSAAAVAANEAALALGSDTGGSIRQPASFCGVVGLKPTYGRVSRYGLISYASSLDQIGTIAKTVSDAFLLYSLIAGPDPRDSTCLSEQFLHNVQEPGTLRIGIPSQSISQGVDVAILSAMETLSQSLRSLGHRLVDIHLPHAKYSLPAYYVIASAEASSNLAKFDGCHYGSRSPQQTLHDMYAVTRGTFFGKEVQRRIMLGTYTLSSGYHDQYYDKACQVRRLITQDFRMAFEHCDVILQPISPTTAFRIGEKSHDPLTMYLSDVYSVTANLAGVPAISVPVGKDSEGLPIGLQLLAPWRQEPLLHRAALEVEQVSP